jgi:hypothetical protein
MDCDQVFMILTRGPFPTGEPSDELVEAHLERCADCWRLAEALRPALELFQEAIPPAESRDLPGYWGDARPVSPLFPELVRPSTLTALAAGMQRVSRQKNQPYQENLTHSFSTEVLRVCALAATLSATILALVLLLRG